MTKSAYVAMSADHCRVLDLQSFEHHLRAEVGCVVGPDQRHRAGETVRNLAGGRRRDSPGVAAITKPRVFNPGRSASVAANYLDELTDSA